MPSLNLGSRATIANSLAYGVDISLELANPHSLIGRLILDDVAIASARLIEANRETMRDAFLRLSQEQQEIEALRKKSAQQQVTAPILYDDSRSQSVDQSSPSSRVFALVAELEALNGKRLVVLNDAALGITMYRMAIKQLAAVKHQFVSTVTDLFVQGTSLATQGIQYIRQAVSESLEDSWSDMQNSIRSLSEEELNKLATMDGYKSFPLTEKGVASLCRHLSKRLGEKEVNSIMAALIPLLEDTSSQSIHWISVADFNRQLIEKSDRGLTESNQKMQKITDDLESRRVFDAQSRQAVGKNPTLRPSSSRSNAKPDDDEEYLQRSGANR